MMDLSGNAAIVTDAAFRVGLGIATALAEAGAKVLSRLHATPTTWTGMIRGSGVTCR